MRLSSRFCYVWRARSLSISADFLPRWNTDLEWSSSMLQYWRIAKNSNVETFFQKVSNGLNFAPESEWESHFVIISILFRFHDPKFLRLRFRFRFQGLEISDSDSDSDSTKNWNRSVSIPIPRFRFPQVWWGLQDFSKSESSPAAIY